MNRLTHIFNLGPPFFHFDFFSQHCFHLVDDDDFGMAVETREEMYPI